MPESNAFLELEANRGNDAKASPRIFCHVIPRAFPYSLRINFVNHRSSRRSFLHRSALAAGALLLPGDCLPAVEDKADPAASMAGLPQGSAPNPVPMPHFPDRLHAFVWRNWSLTPVATMASVVGATKPDILRLARAMGLPKPPAITREQQSRSYLSVIRRNWHLLPYEQLLRLLDWTPEQMAFALREDDFLYIKLGGLKPNCPPLTYAPPDVDTRRRAQEIARVLREEFHQEIDLEGEPLCHFVSELSNPPPAPRRRQVKSRFSPRFCYSYFAPYGDPLLEAAADPYPEGYLERLAADGVDGVWLPALLYKLAPFPWGEAPDQGATKRLQNLRAIVARARKHGVSVYLYLNEPRSLPLRFFDAQPDLKGVVEGDRAALCTSQPQVRKYLTESIAAICRAVPELAGFFTITASENLTNCWSHGNGKQCPRCGARPPADVLAEVNRAFYEGIEQGGGRAELIVWDWGWNNAWVQEIIRQLPRAASLMSVSEWDLPIERGGVKSQVGEYSISAIGPGPRALRHWQLARQRGMKTVAKIQAGNSWELSAVPYIPALRNVAQHAANLRASAVDGLMLSWTCGGYPSPNLDVVAELGCAEGGGALSPEQALRVVAERRFGKSLAPAIVAAWLEFSAAFCEFPFHIEVVYQAPVQVGPANPLWAEPTGYKSTMTGFPYDDLPGWRAIYPPEAFIGQLEKTASGFEAGSERLMARANELDLSQSERRALRRELNVAQAAAIHFKSVANQARFIMNRDRLAKTTDRAEAKPLLAELEAVVRDELKLAKRLFEIQSRDSRIGFEAANHYYYVPMDLLEKVLNCRHLLDHWLEREKQRRGG